MKTKISKTSEKELKSALKNIEKAKLQIDHVVTKSDKKRQNRIKIANVYSGLWEVSNNLIIAIDDCKVVQGFK